MVYTCSHDNYKSSFYKTFAISGNRGQDANYQGDYYPILAPKLSFWNTWHNNIGSIPEYENNYYYIEKYYYEVLRKLDPHQVLKQIDGSILLCYEDPSEFCHRHIVAAWLELLLEISVPEVIVVNSKIFFVSRPTYIKEFLNSIIQQDLENRSTIIANNLNSNIEILVNKTNLLSSSFVPSDLIATDNNEENFHQFMEPTQKPLISQVVYPVYLKMKNDMSKQNLHIILDSGYRSFDYQKKLMTYKIGELGYEQAQNLVAPPGASEHQTGLAFDIALMKNNHYCPDVNETDLEVKWLMENSYKYGFILRYPRGKEYITTYQFEPWHYRYVGPRLAQLLTKYNITMEEYYYQKEFYDQLDNKNVKYRNLSKKTKKR